MSRMATPSRRALVAAVVASAAAITGCTATPESARDEIGGAVPAEDRALVAIPPVANDLVGDAPDDGDGGTEVESGGPNDAGPAFAVIDADGRLALIDHGTVRNDWFKFTAFPSPDRSTAVLTLGPQVEGIGPERPLVWVDLPSGEQVGEQTMRTATELTATSLDGTFAGFTTRAGPTIDGAIAGLRRTSRIEIVSRDHGLVYEQDLDGNFVPEAFSRRMVAGLPALVFLLEYFPADVPRFYRVRVLSTETGEVSLPLNLRDKSEQVDERMAGFSRSQVVAADHGLLFTLYRGTLDGTPEGEPYAFVHTLDLADGVWCLEVDPRLGLDEFAGSLAVGGDRLYVASANGWVGSYPIPSLSDPNRSPSMDWTVELFRPQSSVPPIVADDDGAWLGPADGAGRLIRVDTDGHRGEPLGLPGAAPQALVIDRDGDVHAIGADWETFDLDGRPEWLDDIALIAVH